MSFRDYWILYLKHNAKCHISLKLSFLLFPPRVGKFSLSHDDNFAGRVRIDGEKEKQEMFYLLWYRVDILIFCKNFSKNSYLKICLKKYIDLYFTNIKCNIHAWIFNQIVKFLRKKKRFFKNKVEFATKEFMFHLLRWTFKQMVEFFNKTDYFSRTVAFFTK